MTAYPAPVRGGRAGLAMALSGHLGGRRLLTEVSRLEEWPDRDLFAAYPGG